MSLHRFFAAGDIPNCAPGEPFELPLSEQDAHHAVRVLRIAPGEHVVMVAPDRTACECAVIAVDEHPRPLLSATVVGVLPAAHEVRVTLVQGLPKAAKLDLVIEKAVEVGVEAIWPIEFARSVTRLEKNKVSRKGERLRRVAEAAAKQSGRAYVPFVADPASARGLVERLADFDLVLVCWEEAGPSAPGIGQALRDAALPDDPTIAVVVGPEGGLTPPEVESLQRAGAVTVTLGENALRTETAGILSVALCVYECGGLGGRPRG